MPKHRTVSGVGRERLAQSHSIGLWLRGLRVQSPSLTPDSGNTREVTEIAVPRLKRELRFFLDARNPDNARLADALDDFLAVAP